MKNLYNIFKEYKSILLESVEDQIEDFNTDDLLSQNEFSLDDMIDMISKYVRDNSKPLDIWDGKLWKFEFPKAFVLTEPLNIDGAEFKRIIRIRYSNCWSNGKKCEKLTIVGNYSYAEEICIQRIEDIEETFWISDSSIYSNKLKDVKTFEVLMSEIFRKIMSQKKRIDESVLLESIEDQIDNVDDEDIRRRSEFSRFADLDYEYASDEEQIFKKRCAEYWFSAIEEFRDNCSKHLKNLEIELWFTDCEEDEEKFPNYWWEYWRRLDETFVSLRILPRNIGYRIGDFNDGDNLEIFRIVYQKLYDELRNVRFKIETTGKKGSCFYAENFDIDDIYAKSADDIKYIADDGYYEVSSIYNGKEGLDEMYFFLLELDNKIENLLKKYGK